MSGKVTCDKCSREFTPEVKDVTRRGGIDRFFRCPICRHKYMVAKISTTGVQLTEDIGRVRSELQKFPDSERLKAELQGLLKMLEPEVTKA